MQNTILFLGHSFIVRLHRFLNHSVNFRTNLGLNREHVVYRGYSGCTIDRLSQRGIREVDKFKPALVCLQIGSNDLCSIDVEVHDLVDKIVDFTEMLRGRGVRRVCVFQILHRKPPTKPGRFAVDSEWFNSRVDLVNRLLDERLGRDFLSGVRFWRHAGFWSPENKAMVFCEDGVHLNETQGYPKYYNSVRASVVSGLNSL